MKKVFLLIAVALLPFTASADLVCPEGQMVESVLISEGSAEIPGTPAYDEYVFKGFHQGDYLKLGNGNYLFIGHNNGFYDKIHHEAIPSVPAVDPVYEDQCVADPNYVPPLVCEKGEEVVGDACVPIIEEPTPEPPAPTPSPAPAPIQHSAPPSTSIFRKLCNIYNAFGVGFCPEQNPSLGVVYLGYYDALIASLKAGL